MGPVAPAITAVNILGGQSAVARLLRGSGVGELAEVTQQTVWHWIHKTQIPEIAVPILVDALQEQARAAASIMPRDLRPDLYGRPFSSSSSEAAVTPVV